MWSHLLYHNISPQAGQSVRLFHRECECYIAAEGSFAEHPPVVEDGNEVTNLVNFQSHDTHMTVT